jgi:hypothetical protein
VDEKSLWHYSLGKPDFLGTSADPPEVNYRISGANRLTGQTPTLNSGVPHRRPLFIGFRKCGAGLNAKKIWYADSRKIEEAANLLPSLSQRNLVKN